MIWGHAVRRVGCVAVTTVAFLHTSPVHVPAFGALLFEVAPAVAGVQLVDADLLADVRSAGFDASIEARLLGRLRELAAHAPAVIVCTCSTLSGHAERLAGQVDAPVLRIDRPLAERAVAGGGRVAVVAAVELLRDLAMPVLSSPRLAVLRVVEIATAPA